MLIEFKFQSGHNLGPSYLRMKLAMYVLEFTLRLINAGLLETKDADERLLCALTVELETWVLSVLF